MQLIAIVLIVVGIYAMANLIMWLGAKACQKRGHLWREDDDHPTHKFCGRCHIDYPL